MKLKDLDTPAALIDMQRMTFKLQRMQQRTRLLGVNFRPHVKTSKSIDIAKLQLAAGAKGITVSTLKEAEQFFEAGIKDILYAVGIVESKLWQAAKLIEKGCDLKIITDNSATAAALAAFSVRQGVPLEVWIEIDTDNHRSGVNPENDELLAIGKLLNH